MHSPFRNSNLLSIHYLKSNPQSKGNSNSFAKNDSDFYLNLMVKSRKAVLLQSTFISEWTPNCCARNIQSTPRMVLRTAHIRGDFRAYLSVSVSMSGLDCCVCGKEQKVLAWRYLQQCVRPNTRK